MQFMESSIKGLCANPYCTKGPDGKRAVVAIRDTRENVEYCSQSCAAMSRYKKRYKGTLTGSGTIDQIKQKMEKL